MEDPWKKIAGVLSTFISHWEEGSARHCEAVVLTVTMGWRGGGGLDQGSAPDPEGGPLEKSFRHSPPLDSALWANGAAFRGVASPDILGDGGVGRVVPRGS